MQAWPPFLIIMIVWSYLIYMLGWYLCFRDRPTLTPTVLTLSSTSFPAPTIPHSPFPTPLPASKRHTANAQTRKDSITRV